MVQRRALDFAPVPVKSRGEVKSFRCADGFHHGLELVKRFGSQLVVMDIVKDGLRGGRNQALEKGLQPLPLFVRGDVQGVGFRYFVQRKANQLGLRGWVRNNDDGTVEVVAEGDRAQLEELARALEGGPRMARVDRVETQWSTATGNLQGFDLAW